MQEIKTMGIVARYSDYKDNDRMIGILTPEHGRIDAIARGCRKPKSRLMSAVQPFACAEYVLRKKRERTSVVQADLSESFYDLRMDFTRFESACAVMEVALQTMQPGEPDRALYRLVYYTLTYLSYSSMNTQDIWLCFLAMFLNQQGYCPSTHRCARCGESTFHGGAFHSMLGALCQNCAQRKGGDAISPLSLEALRRMMELPIEEMKKVLLPDVVRKELSAILPVYFQAHVGGRFRSPALNNFSQE